MTLDYPQKTNGMYIVRKGDFDNIATMMLQAYAPDVLETPKAVRIGNIAEECLGLTLDYQRLSLDKSILGLTAFGDTRRECYDELLRPVVLDISEGTVLIDPCLSGDSSLPRRRFTIGHETAHWILHRSYYTQSNRKYQFRKQQNFLIACRSSEIERDRFQRNMGTDEDWIEWQADGLAASLLMPVNTFHTAASSIIRACTGENRLSIDTQKQRYRDVVKKIARLFAVSYKATEIRLKNLGFIKANSQ